MEAPAGEDQATKEEPKAEEKEPKAPAGKKVVKKAGKKGGEGDLDKVDFLH